MLPYDARPNNAAFTAQSKKWKAKVEAKDMANHSSRGFSSSGFFIYSCSYLSVRPGAVLLRTEEEIAAYFNVIGLHLNTALVEKIQENLYIQFLLSQER